MCRFTAFLGQKPFLLENVLRKPGHSLVTQSLSAKEALSKVNGDGFGIGWYNFEVNATPALFKSTLPAWNDQNLIHITQKVLSPCFIGHVRDSTVGNVSYPNCHPFIFGSLLFVHNGTIQEFQKIKKDVIQEISEEDLSKILGQTDSEYFFALFCSILKGDEPNPENMEVAFRKSIEVIETLQKKHGIEDGFTMNVVITNGRQLFSSRYASEPNTAPLSLYYSKEFISKRYPESDFKSIVISSEILDEDKSIWTSVPPYTFLTVDEDLSIDLKPVSGLVN